MNLLSILVGWVLGLLSTLFGQWINTRAQRRKTALLLIQEVDHNWHLLKLISKLMYKFNDSGQIIEEGEVRVDLSQEPLRMNNADPDTTIFSSSLIDQGLFSASTLSSVHDYYRHLDELQTFLDVLEREEEERNPHELEMAINQAEYNAREAKKMTEEVKEKLKGEYISNPLSYLWK